MAWKKLYITLICIVCCFSSYAQKQYNVLNWKGEVSLNTYLLQQLHQQYEVRNANFSKALRSKTAMLAYRDSCRKRYIRLIGNMPKSANLNAQTTGIIQQDGYHIEKVIFESFANHHVTANIYVPGGKGIFPAVLFFCGHEAEAKATESYQKTAILFATHGFVVMMIDPISQGERNQLTDVNGKSLTRGSTTEHTLLNAGSNLVGSSTATYQLWDNVSSLDYLLNRTDVDKSRIGCLGNSGGATQAAYMMAYDPRIKIAALCSYVLNGEQSLEITGPADGCVNFPNESHEHLEAVDYYTMFAPKPALILAGQYDFINYNQVKDAYRETKTVYTVLNQPNKINLFTYTDGHGISKPKREMAVSWFRQWLYNDTVPVKENDLKTLTTKELACTSTGVVNTAYKNELTINGQNISLADQFAKERKPLTQTLLKNIAGIHINNAAIETEWIGDIQKTDYTIKKVILRRKDEVPMPCLVIQSNKNSTGKIGLWLSDAGKNKLADSVNFIADQLKQYDALILADLRGFGETNDPAQYNDAKYVNRKYRNAQLALLIGKPLTGQRVQDVLTLVDFINQNEGFKKLQIEVSASGAAAQAALYAAALNNKIVKLNMFETIASYKYMLQNPLMKNQYSYVLPNVLKYYDVPELIEYVGPGRVKLW